MIRSAGANQQFQFSPLHERQRQTNTEDNGLCYFNSRLYMRGNIYNHTLFIRDNYFNSRLYMRGNQRYKRMGKYFPYFNSRLYMRGNAMLDIITAFTAGFQFTPLHERQQYISDHKTQYRRFQFTPLHERQPDAIETFPCNFYFNSRLYMRGSPMDGSVAVFPKQISIHAST